MLTGRSPHRALIRCALVCISTLTSLSVACAEMDGAIRVRGEYFRCVHDYVIAHPQTDASTATQSAFQACIAQERALARFLASMDMRTSEISKSIAEDKQFLWRDLQGVRTAAR